MLGFFKASKRSVFAAFFVCIFAFGAQGSFAQNFKTPLVIEKADGTLQAFQVELALTNAQRSKGLMYRAELAPDDGMLFIFADLQLMNFWMRNVPISLDIIFLNPDGSIINIAANAEPHTDTHRSSNGPAKAVLELAGGRATELGIKAGDIVRHALLGNMKSGK